MTSAPTPTEIARDVLGIEGAALLAMRDGMPAAFDDVIELLLNVPGRVIVSGMGKSGHIAAKIAATMASTGTPAQTVHPGEASHGDLGMVTPQDAVILISNSGETRELADIIAHTRRFAIPLIAITKKANSTLGQQADHLLKLPDAPEACGIGITPTTSTTCTLALGDALAVALMEHRKFTPENFREFHPGGKLGARLSKVSDLMHVGDKVPLVPADTPMSDALLAISQKGFGVVGVTDANQKLIGIVTDGDLRRHMSGLLDHTAREVMTPSPTTLSPSALAEEAVALMNSKTITCLFAVDPAGQGQVAGFLHIHDCLRAGIV